MDLDTQHKVHIRKGNIPQILKRDRRLSTVDLEPKRLDRNAVREIKIN